VAVSVSNCGVCAKCHVAGTLDGTQHTHHNLKHARS